MTTALPCRGRRALAVLAVACSFGWYTEASPAAIPPMFGVQRAINGSPDDPGASGPNLIPAAIPPTQPPETTPVSQPPVPQPPVVSVPPVVQPPPIVQPPPVVTPPPVTPPTVPVDTPPPHPAAAAPEPASLVMGLLGSGIAGVIALRRRRSGRAEE